jgi:hypothetical protein
MFTSRIDKLKRLLDTAPDDLGSADGRIWVRAVTDFFADELNDPNGAWEIAAIARGGTPASDQMTPQERRAEILQMLEVEIGAGAKPIRTSPPSESDTVKAARFNRSGIIWAAVLTAIAALLGALIGVYLKGWLSGE